LKIVDGNVMIKMLVKDTPTLMGNKLKQNYYKVPLSTQFLCPSSIFQVNPILFVNLLITIDAISPAVHPFAERLFL
jgi:hypothetical protein